MEHAKSYTDDGASTVPYTDIPSLHAWRRSLHDTALMARARRHIAEHVSDPDLAPDDLASALCISRRSLFLLFKRHCVTPARMIHDIRLNQARDALQDPGRARLKMMHIAFDAGFADYATFSRLFKSQFGLTPSEFRSQHCLAQCA